MILIALGMLVMTTIAGCDSDDDPMTASSATPTTLTVQQTVNRFRACLSDGGIQIPPISFGPDDRPIFDDLVRLDISDPAVRNTITGCVGPLAQRGLLDLSVDPALREAVVADLRQFAQCMRDQGISGFPDPEPQYDGSGSAFPADAVPRGTDGFQAAVNTCSGGGGG